ncbi:hypothetical protein GCL60_06650 [Silvanigrella paludirubra]|uniref:Uncharacterized protein n=1 Tax=Silvanigrella paludirubra TaxID=2499159 RepID=A0A6N6VYI8_9BACT|nr:hypothetical protein [Silvanigrella paludirubra]KAB8039936.1 hypothetical protein GCL60_06650 [Silvanigrella paludirubra]
MKIYIIILINILFFSIKVYSNSLNSLEMFLPKDNIEYEDHTESDLPVKSRYEKIEGDLNIFPSKNYLKNKKQPNYNYEQNISNQCDFPSYNYNNSIKIKEGKDYKISINTFIGRNNGYSFENNNIEKNSNINNNYNKNNIYKSDNTIGICPPIHPQIR